MGYPPLEELLPKANHSIYSLARMASTRASELAEGKRPLIDISRQEKVTTIALEEIRAGMVVLKSVADRFGPPPSAPKTEATETNSESSVEE